VLLASPLAVAEHLVLHPIANFPHTFQSAAVGGGEHLGRAYLNLQQGEGAEAAVDVLSAVAQSSTAFLSAASIAAPAVGGLKAAPALEGGAPLSRMSDRAIAQHHLNNVNANTMLNAADTLGLDFSSYMRQQPTAWMVRGNAMQEGLVTSLEGNSVTREIYLGIRQQPGQSVPDLLHVGQGSGLPFADVFPLNPRQMAAHLEGRWYSPFIDPLVYTQPPPGWNPPPIPGR
jgi:hypothetical protein